MIGLYGFGIYLVKLGRVLLTLFVRGGTLTVRTQDITIHGKGLDFPGGASASNPTFLLGSNASSPAKIAINTQGRALLSSTTTAQARTAASVRGNAFRGVQIIEHFVNSTSLAANLVPTTTGGATTAVGIDGKFGVLRLRCGAAATANNRAFVGYGSSDNVLNPSSEPMVFACSAAPAVSLFTVGNPGILFIGFIDSDGTGTPVDAAAFRSDNGAEWVATTRRNAVATTVSTGLIPVIGDWHEFAVTLTDTAATFYIDGALVATIVTNLPGGAGRETGLGVSTRKTGAHAAEGGIEVDYLYLKIPTLNISL